MKPSEKIDDMISALVDWRGSALAHYRDLIAKSNPSLKEDFKWGTAVWTYHDKNILAMSAFKNHIKINFFKGYKLDDPSHIINGGLDSKEHRSIDLGANDSLDEKALMALINQATKG